MKKFLFIAVLTLFSFAAVHAQSNLKQLSSTNSSHAWYAGLDTNTNAGTTTQALKITGTGAYTFQTGVLKISGTGAGVVKLLGSIDNVKFDYAGGVPDSLIVVNKASLQVKTWYITPSRFQYFKLVYVGAGTQTSSVSTSVLIR